MSTENSKSFVLVHGYFENPSRNEAKPDINSRIQVWAARELWRQQPETISGFIFPTGVGYPTIGQKMADLLHTTTPSIPQEAMIVVPKEHAATTTIGEAEEAKKIISKHEGANLISIGREFHLRRIQRDVNRELQKKHEATFISSDAILKDAIRRRPSSLVYTRVKNVIDQWFGSEQDQAMAKRENWINIIDGIPVLGKILLKTINTLTHGSRPLNKFLFRLFQRR